MAISGKSSSVAALLLLVAVLAGSCATGANADIDVANSCTVNATLVNVTVALNASALVDVVVKPGLNVALVGPLLEDLNIVVSGITYILPVADIPNIVDVIVLASIEILCVDTPVCGANGLTINLHVKVLGFLDLALVVPVCALASN